MAEWAEEQGFEISEDAPELLDFYSDRSPYFMAARFDADRAAADDFTEGDAIPVHLAIPTEDPWVPLHILGLDKPGSEVVQADVFLLTDERPTLLGPERPDARALRGGRRPPARRPAVGPAQRVGARRRPGSPTCASTPRPGSSPATWPSTSTATTRHRWTPG